MRSDLEQLHQQQLGPRQAGPAPKYPPQMGRAGTECLGDSIRLRLVTQIHSRIIDQTVN